MSGSSIGAIVGTVVGGSFGFPQLGAIVGGAIGSAVDRPEQPGPGDLGAPKLQLGSQFGRPYGTVRLPVSWISMADEFGAFTRDGAGKGGPGAAGETVFDIDTLGLVCDSSRVIGVSREWCNKTLIVSRLAASSAETRGINLFRDYYGGVEDFYGGPTQTPPPRYEDRVGAANALAYRGMFVREYDSLRCGSVKVLPQHEVEVFTKGSVGDDFQTFEWDNDDGVPYVVPDGVTEITALLWGAGGGQSSGGTTYTTFAVTPGETLTIRTGRFQPIFTQPDYTRSGGGSYILRSGGVFLAAAGGGGGSGTDGLGGGGGGTTGGAGGGPGGGGGGTQSAAGAGGYSPTNPGTAGDNPDQGDGGGPGTPTLSTEYHYGGVGGSGYHGGGGGGVDSIGNTGSGGGGGSGFPPADTESGITRTDSPYYVDGVGTAGNDGLIVLIGVGSVPENELLSDVILAELGTNPEFDPATVDVTDIDDIEVESYYAVGSPFDTIPDLCRIYYVDVVPGPVIKFVKKGKASVDSIPWEDTGVGVNEPGQPFEGLKQGNSDEIPAVHGLQFIDLNRDHNANFVRGDRLATESPDVRKIVTRVGMRPDMAKGRAITATLLARQNTFTADFAVSNKYAAIEPADCVTAEDREGNTYRLRAAAMSYSDGVKSVKWTLDDPSALVASGITDMTDTPTIEIVAPEPVEFLMVNLPSLRDDDVATPGAYGFVWWGGTDSISATLYESATESGTYTSRGTLTSRATVGTTSGALPDWTGGYVWDNVSTVSVVLENDQMSLSSSTYAAMYADASINLAAIGGEVLAFRTATLTAPLTYTLSGFLRGLKGTEWTMPDHATGERFILLNGSGVLRVTHEAAQIGATRYYKAVRTGSSLTGVAATAFVDDGTSLEPYSPHDLRATVSGGDVTVTWERRSRLSVPPYADPILSDVPESYTAELRNGGAVVDSTTTTARTVTFTHTPGYTVAIKQRNAFVGDGYEAEITV